MKHQPVKLFKFFLSFPSVLYVPFVLFCLSNCEGSGDRLPVAEEEEPVVQQSTVVQPTDCVAVFYYEDWDNDGFGNPDVSVESCTQPDGDYVEDNTDCDDGAYYTNPGMDGLDDGWGYLSHVHANYLFSDIDNDCDDDVDEDNSLLMQLPEDMYNPAHSGVITFPVP
jgi:hypothetical protein